MRARTALVAAAWLAISGVAHAQGATAAQARALADDGRVLASAGRFAEACPRFEASQKLEPRPETLAELADCWEHAGRTASAWAAWGEVARAEDGADRKPRAEAARARAAALEPSLVRLAIRVTDPAPGLVVRQDGAELPGGAWGAALPIDPGAHTVEVSAPGRLPFRTTVELQAGTTTITVPALAAGAGAAPAAPAATTAAKLPAPVPPPAPKPSGPWMLSLAIAGAGAITLVVGAGLGLDAGSKRDSAYNEGLCTNRPGGITLCTAEGAARIDSAYDVAAAATAMWVVGGILTGGGLVGYLFTRPALHATPGPSGSAGLGLAGAF